MNVLRVGDRAWLIELDDNAEARGVARQLEHAGYAEVVPGHRTVLVVGDREPALPSLPLDALDEPVGRSVEIPVTYDGPDLAEVAALAGLRADEVVTRHTAPSYTVAFLGFTAGFAYLLGGDPRLEVPRRTDPRERVPAGSVAVAGPYSGVYPRESPGGWRLIGHTQVTLFDAERHAPSLLSAGDRVRFVAL